MRDELDLADAKRVENADDILRRDVEAVLGRIERPRSVAEAPQVWRNHPQAGRRQRNRLMPPEVSVVREAVQQEDRRAFPVIEHGKRQAVDLHVSREPAQLLSRDSVVHHRTHPKQHNGCRGTATHSATSV